MDLHLVWETNWIAQNVNGEAMTLFIQTIFVSYTDSDDRSSGGIRIQCAVGWYGFVSI